MERLEGGERGVDQPGEAANAHQLLHVPQADQRVGTSCGKVFPRGVELDADAVGRVSVDGLDGFELWVAVGSNTYTGVHMTCEGEFAFGCVFRNKRKKISKAFYLLNILSEILTITG